MAEVEDGEERVEDKSRLAFQAGFQYHEWTFKQACVFLLSLLSSILLVPLSSSKAIHPWGFFEPTSLRFRTREIFRRGIEGRVLIGKSYSFVGNRILSKKEKEKKKKNTRIPSPSK